MNKIAMAVIFTVLAGLLALDKIKDNQIDELNERVIKLEARPTKPET